MRPACLACRGRPFTRRQSWGSCRRFESATCCWFPSPRWSGCSMWIRNCRSLRRAADQQWQGVDKQQVAEHHLASASAAACAITIGVGVASGSRSRPTQYLTVSAPNFRQIGNPGRMPPALLSSQRQFARHCRLMPVRREYSTSDTQRPPKSICV